MTTSDDIKITNDQGHRRWVEVMPMCSDGKFLYTLVEYHESDFASPRKAIHLEKYEFKNNTVKYLSSKQLKKSEGEVWQGRGGRNNDDGGFLNFGLLACNGKYAVWCARHCVHIFDIETGLRAG